MKRNNVASNARGFSLIELMIAVAILSVIAAIAIPTYRNYIITAKTSSAQSLLDQFPILLESYRAENGSFPPDGDYDYKEDSSGTITDQSIRTAAGANLPDFNPQSKSSGGAIMFDIHLKISNSGKINESATFSATGVRDGSGISLSDTYPK